MIEVLTSGRIQKFVPCNPHYSSYSEAHKAHYTTRTVAYHRTPKMGKLLDCISPREEEFIASQKVFFVATAPLSPHHFINVSPKAPGTSLVVLGPKKVAYADLTGSGAEAAANVQENGRVTIMFVNIEEGPAKILRLYGSARVVSAKTAERSLVQKFPTSITQSLGFRAIFVVDVERVSSSCGYSMPILTHVKYRSSLDEWFCKRGQDGMDAYRLEKNSFSINGLNSHCSLDGGVDESIMAVRKDGYILGVMKNSQVSSSLKKYLVKTSKRIAVKVERYMTQHLYLTCLTTLVVGIAIGKAA